MIKPKDKRDKQNEKLVELYFQYPVKAQKFLEKHFPEGHKKRGDAIALCIIAFLEGKEVIK